MAKASKIFALMGISLLSFTGFLDATIVSTALPSIQASLHMSVTELQWVMNAFFLGISAFMASMGRVADIYGRRKIFYIGTLIFGIASLGAGLATSAGWLIVFRAIQGITTAITIPVGIALIQTIFDQNETAKAMGIFSSITGAGLALGPVVGGALITAFGWPAVFLVNIPFIVIGFGMCFFTVKESRSTTEMRLDYFGILFLVLTIGALVFAVVEANNYGWESTPIISSFVIFVVSLIFLIVTEAKVAHPIMSGDLFKNRVFISSILFAFAGGGLMSVILFIDPLYLNLIINKNIFLTGVLLFIMPLVVMTSSPIIGRINHHTGPRKIMIYGAIFYILAAASQMFFSAHLNYFLLTAGFIIFGLGWAVVNQAPAVALGQSVAGDHVSVAMGALFSFYNIGAAVMLALGVTLFHWRTQVELLQNFANQHLVLNAQQQALLEQFVKQPDKMSAAPALSY
jgi:EmrB/QacA subfamily drug resistance transporter